MSLRFNLVLVLVALIMAGCAGEEPAGNPITGTVTFQGKPLDQGSIEFSPAAGQGTMSGAPITNGEYTIPAESGLEPGKYDVRISSVEGGAVVDPNEPPGEPTTTAKERIPAEYNTNTTLTAEVKDEGENKIDFTIP